MAALIGPCNLCTGCAVVVLRFVDVVGVVACRSEPTESVARDKLLLGISVIPKKTLESQPVLLLC